MIGYHYTTWEAYEQIRGEGLQLSPLEDRHRPTCVPVLPFIEDGCIWVYPEFMRQQKLIGMIFYVAVRHVSTRVVCLEVEYPKALSATWVAKNTYREEENDPLIDVRLRHSLEIGDAVTQFGHVGQVFDLIREPIDPKDIYLAGSWNLLDFAGVGIAGTRKLMVA